MFSPYLERSAERVLPGIFSGFSLDPDAYPYIIAQGHQGIESLPGIDKIDPPDIFPGDGDLGMAAPTVQNISRHGVPVQVIRGILDIQHAGCYALAVNEYRVIGVGFRGIQPGNACQQAYYH